MAQVKFSVFIYVVEPDILKGGKRHQKRLLKTFNVVKKVQLYRTKCSFLINILLKKFEVISLIGQ